MEKNFKFEYSLAYDDKVNGLRLCHVSRRYHKGDKTVVLTVRYCNGHVSAYHAMRVEKSEHGDFNCFTEYHGVDAIKANHLFALALRNIGVI